MRAIVVAVCVFSVIVTSVARSAPGAEQIPEHFTNLQVVGKDIPRGALVDIMKQVTSALGVRCEYCHVGGPDLATIDFPADDRPTKVTARTMMKMLTTINRDLLKGVGDPAIQPKVTCYTCHRGAARPLIAPAGRAGGSLRQ